RIATLRSQRRPGEKAAKNGQGLNPQPNPSPSRHREHSVAIPDIKTLARITNIRIATLRSQRRIGEKAVKNEQGFNPQPNPSPPRHRERSVAIPDIKTLAGITNIRIATLRSQRRRGSAWAVIGFTIHPRQ
ncbi:MAG: hypothetical protein ACXVJE_18650, partial [Mucilaginibacter sp.]